MKNVHILLGLESVDTVYMTLCAIMILLTGFPLLSVALTTWACVSPQIAIVIMAVVSLLIPACYYIMDKKHVKSPSPASEKHAGVEYTALDANKGSNEMLNLLI